MDTLGLPVRAEEWPHGLCCAECDTLMVDGDRVLIPFYSERLTGMTENPYGDPAIPGDMIAAMVQITCVPCGFGPGSDKGTHDAD